MANVIKTMNAVKTVGEYKNAQGEDKKEYLTIGTLFIYEDGGQSLKIKDGISVSGNINFYEKTEKTKQQNNQQNNHQQNQHQGSYNNQQQHTDYQNNNYQS